MSLSRFVCDSCHSQALWFPLLEAMMSPQKLLKGANAKHTSDGETNTQALILVEMMIRMLFKKNKKIIETIVVYRLNKIYAAGLQV